MDGARSSSVEPGKRRQILAAIVVNIANLSYGITMGWTSPMIPLFLSPNNPVSVDPLTSDDISWFQSALSLAGIPILPICSLISEKFGRKIIGYLIAIPLVASWLLTIFATDLRCLIIARTLAGVGGAFLLFLAPLYVTEISGDSIRGLLGTFMLFALNIGIFSAYVLGTFLSYQSFAICALSLSILFFVCFLLMPETPTFLVRKDRIADATKSLMWLKNGDEAAVNRELLRLQALARENINMKKTVGICDLFKDRATIKGFIIANVLLSGQQTCGITTMLAYTSMILKLAGSSLSPNTGTIIYGGIQIFGSVLSTIFMEKAGRRPLILISCLGMLLCHFAIATFLLLQSRHIDVSLFGRIPLTALSIYVIAYGLGMGPAPYIVASEVFSCEITALACSVSMTIMMIVAFTILKCFPLAIELLGLHTCFYLLAGFCGCTFVFTYFFIPETKGRSIESIINELNGRPKKYNESGYMKAAIEMNQKNTFPSE